MLGYNQLSSDYYSCAVRRMSYKMGSFLRFGVTFVHANLFLHTFTKRCLGWEGGLFEIFSSRFICIAGTFLI